MSAKSYLEQLYRLRLQINSLGSQIEYLENLAKGVKALEYNKDRVMTSPENHFEKIMAKLYDAYGSFTDKVLFYIDLTIQIEEQIFAVDNSDYQKVLLLRYVDFDGTRKRSFEKIASQLNYSEDWVRHLHAKALVAFERKYLQKKHDTKKHIQV